MIIDEVNFGPLLKAFKKFELFRVAAKSELEKAGAILSFGYCFELTWKAMKRLLEARGRIANSPRETFRMAVLEGFIKDPEIWFEFLKKRNLTTHTYEEKTAEEVFSILQQFSEEVVFFFDFLGISKDEYRR